MTAAPRVRGGSGVAAAICLFVALCASVLVAPSASADVAAPSGLTPASGSASSTPTLGWARVADAAKYDVQVDDDSAFGSPAFTVSTVNTRAVVDVALPARTHWWRVRSVNATGVPSAWSTASFAAAAVDVPQPVSPLGGEIQPPDQVPLLTWQGVPGAATYTVQVDETDDFVTPLSSVETRVTSSVAGPLPVGAYFWRVKASLGAGVDSEWSTATPFTMARLPAVTVTGPVDDPDQPVTDVVLTWAPLTGAAYYELQVSTDRDFNTLADPRNGTVGAVTKVFGTRYSPKVTYDNNQYYWRVRAVDTNGQPAPWSETGATGPAQFDRVWHDRPQAVHPLGALDAGSPITHMTGDPYFQWTPVRHATQYELQLSIDPNFSPGQTSNCQTAGTTYTPRNLAINHDTANVTVRPDEACTPMAGTVTYWRVRPMDRLGTSPLVEGLYSPTQRFIYDDTVLGEMTPANGVTVDVPTLRWSPLEDATSYAVKIVNGAGQTVKSVTTASTSYTPVLTSALTADKGPFTWSLTALSPKGTPLSVIRQATFQVSGTMPDTDAAPLAALSGNDPDESTSRAPALAWEPMAGAATYRVSVGTHGAGVFFAHTSADLFDQPTAYPALTDISERLLTPGAYDWQVTAYSSTGGLIGTGPLATFSVAELAAVTGQRIALDGLTLDEGAGCTHQVGDPADLCDKVPSTPVFDWDPVDGAGMYIVYLSEDASFTNLVEPLATLGATTSTRYTPTMAALRAALPDSQSGGAYYWRVRPCKTARVCAPNPVSTTAMATNKFRKVSAPTKLLTPGKGATSSDAALTFTWEDYRSTNAAATWPDTGEHPHQSAMGYHLQVDDDATFTSPVDDVQVDQPTYTAYDRMYPDGVLYWRVQAVDAEGNALAWSETRELTKRTGAPTLTAVQATTSPGTAVFDWTPLPFTGSYDVEVYKNADEAASLTNRVASATTKQATWVPDVPLAASTDYVWRVRRRDATTVRNPGPWSTWSRFTIAGAGPALLSPADGTSQDANGPLLTWAAVAGAASYRVEVTTPASTNLSGSPKTTKATAWAPTSKVPDSTWRWRVVALDANRTQGVLGASGWRTFTVTTPTTGGPPPGGGGTMPPPPPPPVDLAPTVVGMSPGVPGPKSSFTVQFSEPVRNVTGGTLLIRRQGKRAWLRATVSAGGATALLDPKKKLKRRAVYEIVLTGGITDASGKPLAPTTLAVRVR